jgi:hypothetical protein
MEIRDVGFGCLRETGIPFLDGLYPHLGAFKLFGIVYGVFGRDAKGEERTHWQIRENLEAKVTGKIHLLIKVKILIPREARQF